MGYGYGVSASGRYALACDNCGTVGGVRKRTCPHKVLGDTLRCAVRVAVPYCKAPAVCSECFAKLGKTKGLHARCAEPAAASQAEHDAIEAALDAGEAFVIAAWGDWADEVPAGHTKVLFKGRNGEIERIMPHNLYNPAKVKALSAYDALIERAITHTSAA